jgi:hypothetical protein
MLKALRLVPALKKEKNQNNPVYKRVKALNRDSS